MFLKCITFSEKAVILQLCFVDILKTFLHTSIMAFGLAVALNENFMALLICEKGQIHYCNIFPSLKKYETPIFILITLFFAQTGDLCAALV